MINIFKSDFYIEVLVLLSAIIAVCEVFNLQEIVSIVFILTFICVVGLSILILSKYGVNKKIFFNMFLLLLLSFFFVAFNSETNFSFDYMKKWMMFATTVVFMFCCISIQVNKQTKWFICSIFFVLNLFFILIFYLNSNIYTGEYLTFGFSNPNLTGLWIGCIFLGTFLFAKQMSKRIVKIFAYVCCGYLIYFIYLTMSRDALLMCCIFIISTVLINNKKTNKFSRMLLFIISIIPILFAGMYFEVTNNFSISSLFSFMVSEGKSLTSRVDIWDFAFKNFLNHPISGAYYDISYGLGMSQMHNMEVDVLASYGIIVFIAFITYLFGVIKYVNDRCQNKQELLALFCFMMVIFLGMGEAAFVSGAAGFDILACSFLIIARN